MLSFRTLGRDTSRGSTARHKTSNDPEHSQLSKIEASNRSVAILCKTRDLATTGSGGILPSKYVWRASLALRFGAFHRVQGVRGAISLG